MGEKIEISKDLYTVLQVHRKASPEVIEAAYRAMMAIHRFTERAQEITDAYQILSNISARKHYDEEGNRLEGKIVGSYRIVGKIAEGGFGKTYKGEHMRNKGLVCIKHCSEISSESEAVLDNESLAMWDLRHFAIPAIRDLVKLDNGSLALVMSYIPGPTLFQIVDKHGKMDPEHVAWIAQRALNGLYYMHSNGIVNGDVKPQNIIVQPNDHTVVLVDFGLALIKPKRGDEAKGYTKLFAPPEEIEGRVLIPESDLYSLGKTMIFALSGGIEHLEKNRVPKGVPEPLCEFIYRLVQDDPLSRPRVWKGENLCKTIERVRKESFGRTNSGMKPLNIEI